MQADAWWSPRVISYGSSGLSKFSARPAVNQASGIRSKLAAAVLAIDAKHRGHLRKFDVTLAKFRPAGSVIQVVQEIPGLPNTQVKGQDSTRKRAFLVNRR